MAKGQKRSGREPKKPKTVKKPASTDDTSRLRPPASPAPSKGGNK